MSDRFFQIQNFKWGLETRKSELVTQAGALKSVVNAFINAGGELEQRKSLVRTGPPYPANTFGLEATESGLVTFGSRATPNQSSVIATSRTDNVASLQTSVDHNLTAGSVVNIIGITSHSELNGTSVTVIDVPDAIHFTIASTGANYTLTPETEGYINQPLPTGVTYQRLVNVTTIGAASILGGAAEMTAAIYSCNFNGKAFVIATFLSLDGYYFFYDGEAVGASLYGRGEVAYLQTLANLATIFGANANEVADWLADINVGAIGPSDSTGYRETALNGSVLLMSPPSVHFTPTIVKDTTNGLLGSYLVDQNYEGKVGSAAAAKFTVTGGSAGGTISLSAPAKSDGSGTVDLTGGNISWTTSSELTAAAVVAAVNARTYLTGYSATQNVENVTVFAPLEWGNFTFNLSVTVTNVVIGPGGTGVMKVDTSTNAVYVVKQVAHGGGTVQGRCELTVSGATGTVTFLWQPCNQDETTTDVPTSGIALSSTTSPTVSFSHSFATSGTVEGYFLCTVTDSANPNFPVTKIVSVHLELTNNL